jgi:hypothetical protein
MKISIQVIKVYEVETDGGDINDCFSRQEHLRKVENMQSTEIEKVGDLVTVTTDYAEIIDEEME